MSGFQVSLIRELPYALAVTAIIIGCSGMGFVVVAKLPCKPGQAQAMEDLFHSGLADTRGFLGCERIDVVFNEETNTHLLVEYWDGILASVYRLGILKQI